MNKTNFFSTGLLILTLSNNINNSIFSQQKPDSSKPDYIKTSSAQDDSSDLIIDSNLSFEAAIKGQNIPQSIIKNLELVTVQYYSFDGKLHQGQIVLHKDLVKDIQEIFLVIKDSKFLINKVVPISQYNWSDEESTKDNNTSAFNYRFISGTKVMSQHAYALAIDINPLLNPYTKKGTNTPSVSKYDTTKAGTIISGSLIETEFKKRGWNWGGDWKSVKDYQHFEKKLK